MAIGGMSVDDVDDEAEGPLVIEFHNWSSITGRGWFDDYSVGDNVVEHALTVDMGDCCCLSETPCIIFVFTAPVRLGCSAQRVGRMQSMLQVGQRCWGTCKVVDSSIFLRAPI